VSCERAEETDEKKYLRMKFINKATKVLLYIFGSLTVLFIILLFALQFRAIQTFLTHRVAAYFSNELHTTIRIEGLYFKPFSSLSLEKVYIADLNHDTLIYADRLSMRLNLSKLRKKELTVKELIISNGTFNLKKLTDSSTNLSFIVGYFGKPKQEKKSNAFKVNLNRVILEHLEFSYRNPFAEEAQAGGINFNNIGIFDVNGEFSAIDFENHLVKANVKGLTLKEKSGFVLKRFDAFAQVDTNSMYFGNLQAETNYSKIGNELIFSYSKFADFSDFITKVHVEASASDTRIDSRDIAYFAPSVNQIKFNVGLSGHVSGTVNRFSGKDILLKTGKATYVRGDFVVKGLPSIEHTLFDLDLRQFSTNQADIEPIIAGFSGQKDFKLPPFLHTLGHINYSGKATGLYNDFKLMGGLKTALGEVDAKLAIAMKDGNSYKGTVATEHFLLGKLLDNDQLGPLSAKVTVEGEGFNVEEIEAEVDASIAYLTYNGRRYNNLEITGDIYDRVIKGSLDIDDVAFTSRIEGSVSLKELSPLYDFSATVENADLYRMGFVKDSLMVKGNIVSRFKGNGLNNLMGNAKLTSVVLRKADYSTAIDSLVLVAKGEDEARTISIHSDLMDVVMNGEIDLNSFPSYFKSIAKRYLPSWQIDLEPGQQSFDFALRLKRAKPLMMFLAPSINIPDTMVVNGRFSTADSIANLSAYIPMLEVGKLKIKDVIVDEVAMRESLNLTITADRVNITDSLYVKNINISNILSDDSLRFNVKLSDIDAKNQLDLNGLVEFKEKESAMLSLLPSNVIINWENWKLEDKVNFDFHDGNMYVKDFELANLDQHVKIDGLVSKNEADVLDVKFEKFDLKTLAGIMNPLGIDLKGELDGDFQLFSVLKNPYISADIHSTDIYYNDREIGDMTLVAGIDPVTNLVGMEMDITRQDRKTLMITGSYNTKAEENSLNLQAALENSEIVLFEPFLRKLVSDLEGTVSANIHVTGTPWSPIVTGSCEFDKASFTVNYLKTRYTITDQVTVRNSRIELHDMVVVDKNNNKAVASGWVDMGNPADPDIDVQVKAERFMVLNTTAKDNALYYGTAIGTGDFIFKGLTSNMDIDINATTEEGTIFNIPLNASGTVSENDFITFVSQDSTFSESKNSYFDGLTLHIVLDISRNAEANIFTDLGKLSGVGNGNIIMNVTSLGDFEMFGDYVILQGKFTFTAQDFINKIFEISRGGTIRWTGNPSEALINLTAIYEVRTSVAPLYAAAGRAGTNQRVIAQAEMILGGNLLHPEIGFALNFPTDSYVKDELQNYFSDANNVNQQALSLIVRRSFAPGAGSDLTAELNNTFLSAGTELAFNQLNNVISQSLNLNFVDFNIRSFNEASASIRLLNNRLILTGGVTDRRSELNDLNLFGNQVASDVEALYLIRKNGNLLFRASNRLNNRNFLNPNDEYVSAFGLVYRQEFDTLGEFFKRMFTLNRQKKEEEEEGTTATEKDASPSLKGQKVNE